MAKLVKFEFKKVKGVQWILYSILYAKKRYVFKKRDRIIEKHPEFVQKLINQKNTSSCVVTYRLVGAQLEIYFCEKSKKFVFNECQLEVKNKNVAEPSCKIKK